MPTIYQDYDDEPEDVFRPLPDELAPEFYAMEMDGFTEDMSFYASVLQKNDSTLEMGCGTGRIADYFASAHRHTVGIDISFPMLQLAKQKKHPYSFYLCMDMMNPSFVTRFDNIIVPYNTLNLLATEERISACLTGCKDYLEPEGNLLVQLFIPTDTFTSNKRKTFQFQMFDRPQGGRIIKEIIKEYIPESETVLVEERYRVRPMQKGRKNEDFHSIYTIAGFTAEKWLSIFEQLGFIPEYLYGDSKGTPFTNSTSTSLFGIFNSQ